MTNGRFGAAGKESGVVRGASFGWLNHLVPYVFTIHHSPFTIHHSPFTIVHRPVAPLRLWMTSLFPSGSRNCAIQHTGVSVFSMSKVTPPALSCSIVRSI